MSNNYTLRRGTSLRSNQLNDDDSDVAELTSFLGQNFNINDSNMTGFRSSVLRNLNPIELDVQASPRVESPVHAQSRLRHNLEVIRNLPRIELDARAQSRLFHNLGVLRNFNRTIIYDSSDSEDDAPNGPRDHLDLSGQQLLYKELSQDFKINESCPICSEDFTENTRIFVTTCLHIFCFDCMDKWMCKEKKKSCPMCRYNFF